MKDYKWGILGLGTIAHDFAKALNKHHGNIYAVASRSQEKAEAFAKPYAGAKAYGDYDQLLQDNQVDIIYVATPHVNHYEYIKQALSKGKHVLCEKAITVNATELNELVALAKEKQLVLMEAMTIFHMPLYHKLKAMMTANQLGVVKTINVTFGSYKPYDEKNRFFNPELAGGALLDIGTYALSFARYFMSGQPNQVFTTMKPSSSLVDEQSAILLRTSQDEMATISLAFRAKMPKRGMVACENGFVTVEDFPRAQEATIHWLDGRTEVIRMNDSDALINEIIAMEQTISGNDCSYLNVTRDVMKVMDEVRSQWEIERRNK
ncbi:Gfo/Idh/MocA family oxidoreductase [Shouchella sp. 1P09AA]|uniref:Gfo/Idh/MocA family protein n=1 Tax=unclassified Shouchella TaxID=2893065 RepID=UPI00399F2FBA